MPDEDSHGRGKGAVVGAEVGSRIWRRDAFAWTSPPLLQRHGVRCIRLHLLRAAVESMDVVGDPRTAENRLIRAFR